MASAFSNRSWNSINLPTRYTRVTFANTERASYALNTRELTLKVLMDEECQQPIRSFRNDATFLSQLLFAVDSLATVY